MPHPPIPYTLSSDPWWCITPGVPISRPSYIMGQPYGLMGCCVPFALFPFPNHDAAIRHSLQPDKHPMPNLADASRAVLSAAIIMDLRVSLRTRASDPAAEGAISPCVRYNATLDGYELHKGGAVLCWTRDLNVVAALLRGERYEPGFIAKCLDPAYLATELALDADAREAERRRRAQMAEDARSRIAADQEARDRRNALTHQKDAPDDLTLDDLLDTL